MNVRVRPTLSCGASCVLRSLRHRPRLQRRIGPPGVKRNGNPASFGARESETVATNPESV